MYDIIIIGGGLVGAGLASALSRSDLKIALIDARMPSNDDPRLFALNAGSCQFLENLGYWPELLPYAEPIHQVHISHQGHFGAVRLKREQVNLDSLGHVIPAYRIETILNEALSSLSHCTVYRPASLLKINEDGHGIDVIIRTESGEKTLQSSLLIGADGTESTVRKQLNIPVDVFDYHQTAIVTRTLLQRGHKNIAYERFQTKGAIAMLPLKNNECATIWSGEKEKMSELMALSEAEFLSRLQQEFGYRLGRLQGIQQRHAFPLRMVKAEKAVQGCVFLLGNAAHTLHPVAAQGFNLALYEVALLAEMLIAKTGKVTTENLELIFKQTQKQQAFSIGASHRLSRLFSSDSILSIFVAQSGMMGLDLATPVKRKFIKGMLGQTGIVPRLLTSRSEG